VLGNAAWVCFLTGRYEDSLRLTERAFAIDQDQEWLVPNLAHSSLALRRPDEAEAHYRAAIEQRKGGEDFRRTTREVRLLLDLHLDLPRGHDMLALLEAAQAELP
jgi:tetratricopeptide (TPR) repeat protein